MNGWIKLTDKLPESEEFVLVTVKAGTMVDGCELVHDEVTVGMFVNDKTVGGTWYPYFYLERSGNEKYIEEISAWMPLPKPYKEEL